MADYPTPPFPQKKIPMPGRTAEMNPKPDHGEESYTGSGRLEGLKAIITGGDSGIGRAVALVCAREGASLLLSDIDGLYTAPPAQGLRRPSGSSIRSNKASPAVATRSGGAVWAGLESGDWIGKTISKST